MEILNIFKNKNPEKKRAKIKELMDADLFTDNRPELVKLTGLSYDEVDAAVVQYQSILRELYSKQFNREDYSEQLEQQKEIIAYLMGEEKEEERKLAS